MVSSTSSSMKYVLTLRRGGGAPAGPDTPSASFHEASTTTGISTVVIKMRTRAMPSAPTA